MDEDFIEWQKRNGIGALDEDTKLRILEEATQGEDIAFDNNDDK